MSNKDILNALSDIESELFYRKIRDNAPDMSIDSIHKMVKTALVKWHELTGEVID